MDARIIHVERSLTELENGGQAFGPPKTEAGRRTVGYPDLISSAVRWHLSSFTRPEDDGLVFTGPERRSATARELPSPRLAPRAPQSRSASGALPRHTGNNLTAAAGANLRELMARMGHNSTRAALIYLKARVLHEAGEKPQVSRSPRCRNSVPRLRAAAV
jgi:hypothetical protein